MKIQLHNTSHRIFNRYCVLMVLAFFSSYASAGLFGTLSKLGKAVNKADVELPLNKLELPDNIKGFAPASIKPGADGQWEITLPDGTSTRIDSLLKQSVEGSNKPALVIRSSDLPKDMQLFDSLPQDWPLLIQGKNNRLFQLHRGSKAALGYGKVRLPVDNMDDIHNGLWQLQRPSGGYAMRFVRLDNKIDTPLPATAYGSSVGVETVGTDTLINSMHLLKNQTLVISGRIVDGRLIGTGRTSDGVSLQELRQAAGENDIQLVILESEQAHAALKKVSRSMQQARNDGSILHDSIGDLFNRLSDPANPAPITLHSHRSGENQMAIQWWEVEAEDVEGITSASVEMLQGLPRHLLLKSAIIHGPDQERSEELDSRIVPHVPSTIQFYLIFSAILGVTAFHTSWRLWKKVWGLKGRREYSHLLVFLLLWPLHRLLFVLLFIPLFGGFSFIWLVLSAFYWVFNLILFRPTRWVYRCFAVRLTV